MVRTTLHWFGLNLMREILFRRCRLEIEPSGVVRVFRNGQTSDNMNVKRDRLAEVEAAAYGYSDLHKYHVDHKIAVAWLWDLFDNDFADNDDIAHLLRDEPLPGAGTWDEMSRFWFKRVRDGWPLVEHGQALNAMTWTSFLASAIKADRANVDNQNRNDDARNDERDVGRTH